MSDVLKLWFFRDLNDEQRLKLFGLFGLPVDEIGPNHGRQSMALRHITQKLVEMDRDEITPAPEMKPHPDDIAVDQFFDAMKAKLARKRGHGYGGWDDKAECSNEHLSRLLRKHVEKGDPIDVANFCMMIQQRGESIATLYPEPIWRALETALGHIEHMAAFIQKQTAGYSFEGLGEDMPGMQAALVNRPPQTRTMGIPTYTQEHEGSDE
jgi:hypothetical protein